MRSGAHVDPLTRHSPALRLTGRISKYKDEVLYDVVPMEATHILLGRPWQFDRKVFHDGFTSKISFNFHGHKVILKSLSPKEVHEDQVKMREKREKMIKKKFKEKSSHVHTTNKKGNSCSKAYFFSYS